MALLKKYISIEEKKKVLSYLLNRGYVCVASLDVKCDGLKKTRICFNLSLSTSP
jgi:hypothetical protein